MNIQVYDKGDSVKYCGDTLYLRRDNWDDYSFRTTFSVSYCKNSGEVISIGQVKIAVRGMEPQKKEMPGSTTTIEPAIIFQAFLAAAGRGRRKLPPSTAPFTRIVAKKIVSVSSKIVYVMRNLFKGGTKKLTALYSGAKSRSELVATFLAVLELCKANRVKISGEAGSAEITLIKERKK